MDRNWIASASRRCMKAAVTSTAAAALVAQMVPCRAQGEAPSVGIAELERVFWACDHAATRGWIDMAIAASCSQATERLKARKFDGDFERMLAWWRQHKDERHLALDNAAVAARAIADRR